MSASQTPPAPTAGPGPGPGASAGSATDAAGDPSMEDILASIRRILSEDETPASGANPPTPSIAQPAGEDASDDVLVLDSAMMVPEASHTDPDPSATETIAIVPVVQPAAELPAANLVAPEAAAAAASSVDSLVRTLAAERTMQVHTGGPTIEDIVREELRPLLKSWLDANLPPMVERLVRTEIERVVGRFAP
jgi:cell pole-organizing protein PopZ